MIWVAAYAVALGLISYKSLSLQTFRQRFVFAVIVVLWIVTLIIQVSIPGTTPEWIFGVLHFLAGVSMLVTAGKSKWQYVVASWYIPMMVTHIVFSIVKPEIVGTMTPEQFEAFYAYFVISTILTWAQLLTFGIWLIADYGHINIKFVPRYSRGSIHNSGSYFRRTVK